MTDSPAIQVLKYLEAGNTLHIPSQEFGEPYVIKMVGAGVHYMKESRQDLPIDYWNEYSSIFGIGYYAKYLPSPPTPVSHVRRVEL